MHRYDPESRRWTVDYGVQTYPSPPPRSEKKFNLINFASSATKVLLHVSGTGVDKALFILQEQMNDSFFDNEASVRPSHDTDNDLQISPSDEFVNLSIVNTITGLKYRYRDHLVN
ncbi:hypothetical protein PoB_005810900 [Plakobranchus ocellatus]|uniref:Uncharacterized protein n=1 Tax=Plakobranchus ocellatus TaxID=259542 RepID=A0AAV4CKW9_9GAST|nr:hypothetical protein PoB_005810900 [Plakobranchus ocellatus]